MIPWDTLITFAIIVIAAIYLGRKFTSPKKSGNCGCSSQDGCGGAGHGSSVGCQGPHHHRH